MAFSMQLHEVQKFNTRTDVMVFLEGHLFLNMHWGRTVKKGHGLQTGKSLGTAFKHHNAVEAK